MVAAPTSRSTLQITIESPDETIRRRNGKFACSNAAVERTTRILAEAEVSPNYQRLLDQGVESSMAEAIDNESHAQTLCFTTKDAREAITAFREKRDPVFRGR